MKLLNCVTASMLAIGGLTPLGCKEEPATTPPPPAKVPTTQTAGEKVSGAIGSAGQKLGEATDAANHKLGTAADATGQAARTAKDSAAAAMTPSGTGGDMASGVSSAIEGVVQVAGKRNNWNDMTDHLTKADADRVLAGKPDSKDLDDLADKFADTWSKKYNDKFSVIDANAAFGGDFVKLESMAVDKDHPSAKGTVAAGQGLPMLEMNFVGEGGKWRLDLPDDVDAKAFHDNLLKALTDIQDATKWPDNKVEAERMVGHRMLQAVLNK